MVVCKDVVAIISARGGSKRIPKKNIINFCGKPMIAWTIEAAQKSKIFDRVIVSTDSGEIAEIALKYKAEVPFIRDKYCDDNSTVSQVVVHTLEQLKILKGEEYKTVVQLMPNCPLRSANEIRSAYKEFVQSSAKFQISCFSFGWMNPWWAFTLTEKKNAKVIFPDALQSRSQDLEKLYCPTGAIWIANVQALLKIKSFYTAETTFYPIDWKSALDIDNYEDLDMARAVYATNFLKSDTEIF